MDRAIGHFLMCEVVEVNKSVAVIAGELMRNSRSVYLNALLPAFILPSECLYPVSLPQSFVPVSELMTE